MSSIVCRVETFGSENDESVGRRKDQDQRMFVR